MTDTPIAEDFAAIAARLAEIRPQPNKPLPSLQEIAERMETERLRQEYAGGGHGA